MADPRLVFREVAGREVEGRMARVVVAARTYDTTPDDLWDALTNPERLPRWFLPVEGDLRLGGRYQLVGNAGGEITACEPPRRLAVTWGMHGQVSWVTVTLEPEGGGTRLTLEHVAHVEGEFWDQFGPGAVGVGWDLSIRALGLHLATGEALPADTEAVFAASEEGRAYIAGCSDAWTEASIAAGTEPAAARAAGARTTAFYTGT